MSFGRSSSNNRSGSLGKSKKDRRKKQEFHRHKAKFEKETDAGADNFSLLKEKTLVAIAHLGKQQFSAEPGGYGYENWIKSFNLLLEQFEEGANPQIFPPEYFQMKQELNAKNLATKPVDPESAKEILELRNRQMMLEKGLQKMGAKLAHARAGSDLASKIDTLNNERNKIIDQLEEERSRLATSKKKEDEDSKKFFKRLFSRGNSRALEIASLSKEIASHELKVEQLDERIQELRGRKDTTGYRILSEEELEEEFPQQFHELLEIRTNLEELEKKRGMENDSSKAREDFANSMSMVISKIETQPEMKPSIEEE